MTMLPCRWSAKVQFSARVCSSSASSHVFCGAWKSETSREDTSVNDDLELGLLQMFIINNSWKNNSLSLRGSLGNVPVMVLTKVFWTHSDKNPNIADIHTQVASLHTYIQQVISHSYINTHKYVLLFLSCKPFGKYCLVPSLPSNRRDTSWTFWTVQYFTQ